MADQPLRLRSDADLEAALRGLGDAIAWPAATPVAGDERDLAALVRARIEADPRSVRPAPRRWDWRPARRALIAAVIILLALAALAGAAGLGLPGLRLILGPAPVSPPPSLVTGSSPGAAGSSGVTSAEPGVTPGVPGSTMGLGAHVPLDELDARAGFHVTWPRDPAIGPPDAAFVDDAKGHQVALLWRSRPGLPDTLQAGVGLVLTAFQGAVDSGFYTKALGSGTRVQLMTVHGDRAYWLSGDPHFLYYEGPDGFIHDPRGWIGDALLWARGPTTYRLETSLDQDATIRLAESVP